MSIFKSDAGADRRYSRSDRGNVKSKTHDMKAVVGSLPGCSTHQTRSLREDTVNKRRPVYKQPIVKE